MNENAGEHDTATRPGRKRGHRAPPSPRLRRRRASVLIVLDRLDRPAAFYIQADDLEHERFLTSAALAAWEAMVAALERAA